MAAGVQSGIGLVSSGSAFAVLQSAGMAGMAATTQGVIGGIGAGIAGGLMGFFGEDKVVELVGDGKDAVKDGVEGIKDGIDVLRKYFSDNKQKGNEFNEEQYQVYAWFEEKINLGDNNDDYYDLFIQNGFDTIEKIKGMTKVDLDDIGIKRLKHKWRILKEIDQL